VMDLQIASGAAELAAPVVAFEDLESQGASSRAASHLPALHSLEGES
jgi:hypothetical protein